MNYYNEFDPNAAAWLRELISAGLIAPGEVDERSITDVRASDLLGYNQCHFFAGVGGWALALHSAGVSCDEALWTGSCPCQPFSSCGNNIGFGDPRHLWPYWFRLISECKPATILGEQVASASALHWLDLVCDDLEGEGYACGAADLCSAGVIAPDIRQRLWWVANLNGERQPEPRQHRKDTSHHAAAGFGEADRLVDAVRRNALPFLCCGHDGLPSRVGQVAIKGFGNAINPEVAAQFIQAAREAITA